MDFLVVFVGYPFASRDRLPRLVALALQLASKFGWDC